MIDRHQDFVCFIVAFLLDERLGLQHSLFGHAFSSFGTAARVQQQSFTITTLRCAYRSMKTGERR
jgi:hypothetical protein